MSKLINSNKRFEKLFKNNLFMNPLTFTHRSLLSKLYDDYFNFLEEFNDDSNSASNIYSTEKEYIIEYAKSGIPIEKWDISIQDNNILVVSAEYNEEIEENVEYYKKSFYSYKINDRLKIPREVDIDKIEASYKDGILKIKMPKLENPDISYGKQIKIKKE